MRKAFPLLLGIVLGVTLTFALRGEAAPYITPPPPTGGSGAPTTAGYWVTVADGTLSAEQAMGALPTGIVKNTGTTGVPSIAVAGTDYAAPTSGSAVLLGNGAGGFSNYTGSACTNTFARSTNASGAHTCDGVSLADFVANQGTTSTVLHGNAAGQPTWGAVALGTDTSGTLPLAQLTDSGTASLCLLSGGAGGDPTWTTCPGGGGSPGGSSGQVQYNNGGAFAGTSQVTSDGTNFVFTGTTTEPAAPAAGSLKLWAHQPHGTNGPVLPFWKGGATQVDYRLFPEVLSTDPVWGCLQPAAWGSTTITPVGAMAAGSATGTAASVAWAATDARTRTRWVQYPAAATANTNAGLRANVDYVWRGNAAGLGGFYLWGSFALPLVTSTSRVFVGLKDATAVLTATSDPNAALDTVYFGCNAADSNLSICSNDNTSTATCTTLGANFPCHTNNASYDFALWAAPNGSSIGYYIRHVTTLNATSGTVSTDLPRNTVALGWDFTVNTGSTASANQIHFGGVCYIANP